MLRIVSELVTMPLPSLRHDSCAHALSAAAVVAARTDAVIVFLEFPI